MCLKVPSAKWQQFCLGLNVIKAMLQGIGITIIKMRLSYLYNGNSYAGMMASLYREHPSF